MNWDAVTAIATALSTVVIAVGGGVAVYQLSEGRRASQFDATQRMINSLLEDRFIEAVHVVMNDLSKRLQDPEYAAALANSRGWDVDPAKHPELVVLARLEEVGTYARHGLISTDALLDFNAEFILQAWEHLLPVVELTRRSHRNPHVWKNTEFLYNRARAVRRD